MKNCQRESSSLVGAVLLGKCVGQQDNFTLLSEALVEELVILIVEVDDVVEVEAAAEHSSSSTVYFKNRCEHLEIQGTRGNWE